MTANIPPFEERLHDLIKKHFTFEVWPAREIILTHVPLEWGKGYWIVKNQAGEEALIDKLTHDLRDAQKWFVTMNLVFDYYNTMPALSQAHHDGSLGRMIAEYVEKNPERYPATVHDEAMVLVKPVIPNQDFWPYYFMPVMQAIARPHEEDYYGDFSLSRAAYQGVTYGNMDSEEYSEGACPGLREIAKKAELEKPCVVFKLHDDGMVPGKLHAKLLTVSVPHAGELPLIVGGKWYLTEGREKPTDKHVRHIVYFDWRPKIDPRRYRGTGHGGNAPWISDYLYPEETDEMKAAQTALEILGDRFLGSDPDGFEDWVQYKEVLAFHYREQ